MKWSVLLVLAFAALAFAADNETTRFLGAESDWAFARLELRNNNPFSGGSLVAICASGSACVRLVSPVQEEKRFFFTLSREDALALVRLAAQEDILSAKPTEHPGAPDEGRPQLVLENALGVTRSILRWEGDKVPALEKVEQALRALEKKCEGKEPAYTGKFEPFFRPFEGVPVTIGLYSGRPDPSFELVRPEDWEKLRSLASELEKTERPARKDPGLGYRGFLLAPRGVPGLPKWVSVYDGVVQTGESPRDVIHHKDQRGLEAWLKAEAKKRGIDVAAPR